ncbi:MAG: hypothetical protein LLG01_01340 [Planctomycetaceae bacterium]|nr:hypothetical protein [Planctomycetaceae bacterium]
MAMTHSSHAPTSLMDRSASRLASMASMIVSLVAITAIVTCMIFSAKLNATLTTYLFVWLLLLALVLAAGIQMFMGQVWGLWLSLVFYLVVAGGAMVALVGAMLAAGAGGPSPAWWTDLVKDTAMPANVIVLLIPLLGAGAVMSVMMVQASAAAGRLRYAAMVSVTVAVAVTLAFVINLIAQSDYARWNMESSGAGVSDRTNQILKSLDQPVTLTCAYSATDKAAAEISREYGPRTLELLRDMADRCDKIKVVDASSDVAKARVIARLSQGESEKFKAHDKFLKSFDAQGKSISDTLLQNRQRWEKAAGATFLNLWGLTPRVAVVLNRQSQQLSQTHRQVQADIKGAALPDYAKLTQDVQTSLKETSQALEELNVLMVHLSELPAAVNKNAKGTLDCADEALAAAMTMARAIGSPDKPAPEDPSAVLGQFITAAREAAKKSAAVATSLDNVAGAADGRIVNSCRAMQDEVEASPDQPVKVRGMLGDIYRQRAQLIDALAVDAEGYIAAAKKEYQAEMVARMRKQVVWLALALRQAREKLDTGLKQLSAADPLSESFFTQAREGTLFGSADKTVKGLIEQLDKLPKLESTSLAADLRKDNIIIVDVGGKNKVVDFDQVWTPRNATPWSAGKEETLRAFNGDTAVASAILAKTSKPFATVWLTYFEVPSAQRNPEGMAPLSPEQFRTLTQRLEESNFVVRRWNLAEPKPAAKADDPSAQVLLILPPPSGPADPANPDSRFGPEHLGRLKEAIDSGIGAIFLGMFIPPRQTMYGMAPMSPAYMLNDYLRQNWGVEVKSEFLLIRAMTDPSDPNRFKVSRQRISYVPLNDYTDHPIVKPLQGQRTLWQGVCPLQETATKVPNVTLTPLLSVPAAWHDTWATARIQELVARLYSNESSQIWPEYDQGDMRTPFPVAIAAVRDGKAKADSRPAATQGAATQGQGAARIVVLSLTPGLVDNYIDQQVETEDVKGAITLAPAPRANADLIANSVYWLIGQTNYIAAGPANTDVVNINDQSRRLLAVLLIVVLPLMVVMAGVTVMTLRR